MFGNNLGRPACPAAATRGHQLHKQLITSSLSCRRSQSATTRWRGRPGRLAYTRRYPGTYFIYAKVKFADQHGGHLLTKLTEGHRSARKRKGLLVQLTEVLNQQVPVNKVPQISDDRLRGSPINESRLTSFQDYGGPGSAFGGRVTGGNGKGEEGDGSARL